MKITVHSENEKKRPVFGGKKSDSDKSEKAEKPEKKRKSGGLSLGGKKRKEEDSELDLESVVKQKRVKPKAEPEPEPEPKEEPVDIADATQSESDEIEENRAVPESADEDQLVAEEQTSQSASPKLKLAKPEKKRSQPIVEDDDVDSDEYFDEMYDTYAMDTDSLTPSFGILVVVLIVVLSVVGYFAGGILFDMVNMLGLV